MDHITMSNKETEQMKAFEQVKAHNLTRMGAAVQLGLTYRQVSNKYNRYLSHGAQGLVHRGRGRPSNRRTPEEVKTFTLEFLHGLWKGFKPKFVSEQLLERYEIEYSRESVRKLMIANGLWFGKKRGAMQHRERRERKEYFGEMIQLDGSPHDWFEGRGPRCTLLAFIDDATSQHAWLEFAVSESLESVMVATRKYIEKYGRPFSIYVDYGSVFRVNTNNPDNLKITQFKRSLNELGIKLIYARSPQAKGRVERSHSTNQDRLVWKLRLANISTMEEGNAYLQDVYMADHNTKFAVDAAKPDDMHRSAEGFNLDNIFCIKVVRKIQNDYIISYKKRLFQIKKQQSTIIRPKEEVIVHERFDRSVEVWIRKVKLAFKEIVQRPVKKISESGQVKPYKYNKPKAHPWHIGKKIEQKETPQLIKMKGVTTDPNI